MKRGFNMQSVFIRLSTIQDVRSFVEIVCASDVDIDLSSGRYVVDAKSIMGIFSLDLLNPIKLTAHSDNCKELFDKLSQFVVNE
jgi:phosphotransferase system HPr-like phosphotransfer protein